MSGQAEKVLAVAKAEVGYREGISNGHYNNHQKYSPAVPGLEWSQGMAWCQTFQAWIFLKAGIANLGPVTASCATGVSWFKSRNRWSEWPAIGGMVFFGPGGGSHVGIVYKYDANSIYTVEGNTSGGGSSVSNGVYLKVRPRRDAYTYGYGLPRYSEGITTADPGKNGAAGFHFKATATSPASTVVVPEPEPLPGLYVVVKDDTLWSLARRFKTTVSQLKTWNKLTSNALAIGQKLKVTSTAVKTHKVVRGDNLWSIATRYTSTVKAIKSLNNLKSDVLSIGQVLKIPSPSASPPPPVTAPNQVLVLVNKERAKEGKKPLVEDALLTKYALAWSKQMSDENKLYHSDLSFAGNARGENVASGYTSAAAVVTGWMNSPGHRTNIMSSGFTKMGIGRVGNYWTQVFASGTVASTPSAPKPTTEPKPASDVSASGVISTKDITFNRNTRTGTLESWVKEAAAKAGVTYSAAWLAGYKVGIQRESSGNANAANVWDVNAKTPAGYSKVKDYGDGYYRDGSIRKLNGALTHFQCSRGIVQCIPQTFAKYHAPGTSVNIYDPVASIAASMRYVMDEYGVLKNGSNLQQKVSQFNPNKAPGWY